MNGCFHETKVVDLKYFLGKQGLRGTCCDLKTLGEVGLSEKKVCKVLGPRFDKNGWKFKLYTNIVTHEVVVNMYTHVYEKEKILNDMIILEFVRILVAKDKRIKLN